MTIETIAIIAAAVSVALTTVLAIAVLKWRSAAPQQATGEPDRLERMSLDLANQRGAMDAQLTEMNRQLASLQSTVGEREGALDSKLGALDTAVKGVVGLFASNQQRGSWGELSLKRIFELAGMVEKRDFTLQFTAGDRRPDAIVHLPHGRTIVIDAKFPTARYIEAMQEEDEAKRLALLKDHAKVLEETGKALANKHYHEQSTAAYVIMYVPSQAVYEAAMHVGDGAVERLMAKGVIVAGPAAVYGLVMTAGSLLAEAQRLDDAEEILEQVVVLRDRLNTFTGYLGSVGTSINKAAEAFNKAVRSWDTRLKPAIDKATTMAHLPDVASIETVDEYVATTTPQDLKEAS